jgi:pimeloyl-ACP methyl ester carboxylesterase
MKSPRRTATFSVFSAFPTVNVRERIFYFTLVSHLTFISLSILAGPSPSRKPVLLQHGLLDSSFTWILNWPEQSLAYILADAGFDVWLGNVRGNRYSQGHVSNLTNFWEYSWDQHALIGAPPGGFRNLPREIRRFSDSSFRGLIQIFQRQSTIFFR